MKKTILLFFSFLLTVNPSSFLHAKDYLANRIAPQDKRAASFNLCFELLEHRQAKVLVETGTARNGLKNCEGDGCSTPLFADWALDHAATLYSVDINSSALSESQEAVAPINPHVQFTLGDSVGFLESFGQQLDFLYLDSYDFDFNDPHPSQEHHLKEIIAAYPYLHKETVIMVDDCDLPYGGKGKLVIAYLIECGWEVLFSGYQTILIFPPDS